MSKCKSMVISIIIISLIVLSFFLTCAVGSADISIADVVDTIYKQIIGRYADGIDKSLKYIIWDLRLPRAILAIAVGGGLAVAGAAMQSITQNVMADPYTLGVSSGALAAVSIGYFIGGVVTESSYGITLAAFGGASISLMMVYVIGGIGRTKSVNRLILSGMSVSITLNAVAQFFISMQPDSVKVQGILSWMMGSLASARWENIALPFFGIMAASLYFVLNARYFDLMALGEDTAISLGTNVKKVEGTALIIVSLITGMAVASGGLIGLVGFVIPHVVRFMIGTSHRRLFPVVFLTGGLFLTWMDILARTLLAPREIPIGVFTALCGGPFFIWMLRKKNKG